MNVLLLAGTTEARQVAESTQCIRGLDVIASLAGHTAPRHALPGAFRTGGFGGIDGLIEWVLEHRIDAIVDATHPFATNMPHHALAAALATGTPHVRLLRPPWTPTSGDRWIDASDVADAARQVEQHVERHVEQHGARRVLLTIGRLELEPFAPLDDVDLVVRSIDASGPLPFDPVAVLHARGPFTVDDEIDVLQAHRIDLLVTKNSGGDDAKLVAARRQGVPVVMVRRPPPVECATVASAADAVSWLQALAR
jgi:precorrin-6A/cobalt-precorrin-6A reductase